MKRLLTAMVFCAVPALLAADEVKLKSGGRLEGKVRRDGDKVVVETLTGELTFKLDDIESIDEAHTAKIEEYYVKAPAAKTGKEFLDLALWAKENRATRFVALNVEKAARTAKDAREMMDLAASYRGTLAADLKPLWERVIQSEPDHEAARRELGYRRHGDQWLTEEEYNGALGNVKFEGKWIAAAERDLILKERLAKLDARIKAVEDREKKVASEKEKLDLAMRLTEEKSKNVEADKKEVEKKAKDVEDREKKVKVKEKVLGELIFCSACHGYHVGPTHICPSTWTVYCPTCEGWFKSGHKHTK